MAGISREFLDGILNVSFFRTVLGGEVIQFGDGRCELALTLRPEHRQFLGAAHGGIIGAMADDACAWACASLAGELVTASYAVNFLSAAKGERLIARGEILKPGKRIAVGRSDVFAIEGGREVRVAAFQGTMAVVA